ncbi:MAG: hypothetical protein LBV34_07525, partial [Nocardiopsaceae bacterium]|nr:hypothetical protein [Nocardiopsaceae bacterium]
PASRALEVREPPRCADPGTSAFISVGAPNGPIWALGKLGRSRGFPLMPMSGCQRVPQSAHLGVALFDMAGLVRIALLT